MGAPRFSMTKLRPRFSVSSRIRPNCDRAPSAEMTLVSPSGLIDGSFRNKVDSSINLTVRFALLECQGRAQAPLESEGIELIFGEDALAEVARFAARVNESSENIGARRLHAIMEKLLEEVSFEGPDLKKKTVKIDAAYVQKQLADIVKDQDLSRYIL